jgi:curli biogenesis system outer membrane secretion channel CsgG
MKHISIFCSALAILVLGFMGCTTTETSRALDTPQTQAAFRPYHGPRAPIVVGNFDNRSGFMRGLFSDGGDRLGSQAKTVLMSHLTQTNRFVVLDRDNMDETMREAQIRGETQELMGASFVLTGDVSEFGRKEVTTYALFGILGRGRQQVAYTRVNINVVDIRTSVVIFSAQGAGEYVLSDLEVLGFGTVAGYDSTLNGKVLDLAIREAVDRLAEAIDNGRWSPAGI